jgi:hypothetical protein
MLLSSFIIIIISCQKSANEKISSTLCPKILPLRARERALIPLVVYLTPKLPRNHIKCSAKAKNTRENKINPNKDLFDNKK